MLTLNFSVSHADNIRAGIAAKEVEMNISPVAASTARSIEDMGNLLRSITDSSMGLQEKLLKTDITEKVSDEKLGNILDLMA